MSDLKYSAINTTIRILEKDLLNSTTMDALLKSRDFQSTVQLLKSTAYSDLTYNFQSELTAHQVELYQKLQGQLPQNEEALFTLIYVYHNLKVLLKTELTPLDLSDLFIPIGYSKEVLQNVVKQGDSSELPVILINHVNDAIAQYKEYERVEEIDMMMDMAYFAHLNELAQTMNEPVVSELVTAWIDVYNFNCIWRLKDKKLSRSFFKTVLADNGQISKSVLIELTLQQSWQKLKDLLKTVSYYEAVQFIAESESIQSIQLDLAKDIVTVYYLKEASLQPFGILPVLAFLYYKEMEIKNLRFILTGKDNQFDESTLRERVRPIYEL